MSVMLLPLAAEPAAMTRTPEPAPLLGELAALRRENAALLYVENAALRVENGALHERIRELAARLGQTSVNSSRPPSSDPPEASARPKAPPSGRKRGGQPGHRGVHRALCYVHLKRDFQALVDRGRAAAPVGRWGLAESERLFALWHRLRAGEFNRPELQRRLIPLQAQLGRLSRRGQETPDHKAAGVCRELTKWWPALWIFARVEGVEPTNHVSERALRPTVLWRKGSFGCDSEAGSRFTERVLTVAATCWQQGRGLLDFPVAASEAALRGSPPPSLVPVRQGR